MTPDGLESKPATPAERKRVRKKLETREQIPTTEQQSAGYVAWKHMETFMATPFDSANVPLRVLYQMRRDPVIGFALHFIKTPLMRSSFHVECEDAQVAAFLDGATRRIFARLVLQFMLSLDFGYQAIVKAFEHDMPDWKYVPRDSEDDIPVPVWDEGPIKAIVWKPFVPLKPERVEPRFTAGGDFDGMSYVDLVSGNSGQTPGRRDIDVYHSLWMTNERDSEFGSLYGWPRIAYAARPWWSHLHTWALSDRHFEKDADPPLIVRHPNEISVDEDTGEREYDRDVAIAIGEKMRSGSTVALPSDMVIDEINNRITAMYKWDIKPLEHSGNFDAFLQKLEYLDIAKIRATMTPEQALVEGKGGTSSRNVASTFGDLFVESQAVLAEQCADTVTRYMYPQLIAANFPEKDNIRAKLVMGGFAEADIDSMREVVRLAGQQTPEDMGADIPEIMDRLGIPRLTAEELAKRKAEAIEESQNSLPPEVEPIPGVAAGVDDLGFYHDPRGLITLSDDTSFIKGLNSQHYEDKEVLKAARQMRKLWRQHIGEELEDFARFVGEIDGLEFDDPDAVKEDRAREQAEKIVTAWTRGAKRIAAVTAKTMELIAKVMDRAGTIELERAHIDMPQWNMDNADVRLWMEDRGARFVRNIDDTLRNDLRIFLAAELGKVQSPVEIANSIRDHFGDWPGWKADRIARTEVRDAYNGATLLAGRQNGITQVQAFDGSGGLSGVTDEHCEERDGQMFTIDEALEEDEHPNGTLGWRLLPRTVSVELVDDAPSEDTDALAVFDDETGIAWISSSIDETKRKRFIHDIGRHVQRLGPKADPPEDA